ncbi:MAG: response regulator, partial [Bifidobacterium psychraerophilum]
MPKGRTWTVLSSVPRGRTTVPTEKVRVLMKILIADDDPQLLKALRITLRSQGYEIITAQDGESGIRKAIDERPDLFILDIGM